MGFYVNAGADFKWQISNGPARPQTAYGSAVTPGANVMGGWVQVLSAAAMVNDAYGILINVNSASTSAATRNVLVDIGIDNGGGTAYQVKIPFLLCGHAAPYNIGSGGVWYYFPLFIPRGSSVAVRAQSNVTTAIRCAVTVYGQPRRPDAVRVGSKVFAFGQDTAASRGTTFTLGTTAEGAWTQVGAPTPMRLWWWQLGYSATDTTMSSQAIHMDTGAGIGANIKPLIQDALICVSTNEQINNSPLTAGCMANVAPGQNVYVRGQTSGTPDSLTCAMVYGLGG